MRNIENKKLCDARWRSKETNKEAARKRAASLNRKDPDKKRHANLIRRYGITLDEKKKMAAEQDMRCFLCGQEYELSTLCVDHNHHTSAVRKLLCKACNMAVGVIETKPNLLEKIAAYLKYYST